MLSRYARSMMVRGIQSHLEVMYGTVRVKAVYLDIGINLAGENEVLASGSPSPKAPSSGWQVITD